MGEGGIPAPQEMRVALQGLSLPSKIVYLKSVFHTAKSGEHFRSSRVVPSTKEKVAGAQYMHLVPGTWTVDDGKVSSPVLGI